MSTSVDFYGIAVLSNSWKFYIFHKITDKIPNFVLTHMLMQKVEMVKKNVLLLDRSQLQLLDNDYAH